VPDPVVDVEGLTKSYGSVTALRGVSFELPAGAWGLLGPNGAGKTTLIRILLGLEGPTRGSATVLGEDPTDDPIRIRERVGLVPERDAHVPGLSGVRFVAFAGQLAGLPEDEAMQRAHEVLNFAGLGEERYREVADYSTGMLQRAKLAQAIVHGPELVFLDEPTNGLDPDGREEMLDLVASLPDRHDISVILASHVLPEVEATCEGALLLDQGRVVANDRLETLMATREATYRVRIRGDVERFRGALETVDASLEQTPEGTLLVTAPAEAGTRTVLEAAQAAGVHVRQLEPARASLEDALVTALEEGAA
jgi:ABC-2 type transport system ATP-binding protein